MTTDKSRVSTGSCFCNAVQYRINGPLRNVINCHCSECTKLNGNFGSHSKTHKSNLVITRDEGLAWFQITKTARRGFCQKCGSGLFWDNQQQDGMGIIAGSLDKPTGLETIGHIFVENKADFYDINDQARQFKGSSEGELEGDHL